jgi:hypothetical protein
MQANKPLYTYDIYNTDKINFNVGPVMGTEIVVKFKNHDIIIYSEINKIDTFDIDAAEINEITETNNDNIEPVELTNNNEFLKNINISDLGENDDLTSSKSEYKKMSLNKLREVVVSKGVITDASKLKKNEILKILGDD